MYLFVNLFIVNQWRGQDSRIDSDIFFFVYATYLPLKKIIQKFSKTQKCLLKSRDRS